MWRYSKSTYNATLYCISPCSVRKVNSANSVKLDGPRNATKYEFAQVPFVLRISTRRISSFHRNNLYSRLTRRSLCFLDFSRVPTMCACQFHGNNLQIICVTWILQGNCIRNKRKKCLGSKAKQWRILREVYADIKAERNEVRRSRWVRNLFICFTMPSGAIGIDRVILVRRARALSIVTVRMTVAEGTQTHCNYMLKVLVRILSSYASPDSFRKIRAYLSHLRKPPPHSPCYRGIISWSM